MTGESAQEENKGNSGRNLLRFLLHLAAVYVIANFCVSASAGWIYNYFLPALQIHTNRTRFEFLFSHLLFFSVVPAFLSGLLNARFRHRVAEFVWVVPTVVLLYKMITFPVSGSVLMQSHSWPAIHKYFGGGFRISEFHNWAELYGFFSNPDMMRGLSQLRFSVPFYAGIAYSLAAILSRRNQALQAALDRLRESERRHRDMVLEETSSELPPEQPRVLAR